ncbi:MAG: phage integrase N-terminal SAM-like domain-containing protein, partial [bacterium]|nr:phage integrase N-terminal SAM-like domain-containing protein [bacterium]
MRIKHLLTDFLEYLEIERNRSPKTIENYHHYLERFFEWSKVTDPGDITQDIIRKFRLDLNRYQDGKGEVLKKITQNYHVIALRSFLKYLAKRDIPAISPEKIEVGKNPAQVVEFLELAEIERLLNSAGGSDFNGTTDFDRTNYFETLPSNELAHGLWLEADRMR